MSGVCVSGCRRATLSRALSAVLRILPVSLVTDDIPIRSASAVNLQGDEEFFADQGTRRALPKRSEEAFRNANFVAGQDFGLRRHVDGKFVAAAGDLDRA